MPEQIFEFDGGIDTLTYYIPVLLKPASLIPMPYLANIMNLHAALTQLLVITP